MTTLREAAELYLISELALRETPNAQLSRLARDEAQRELEHVLAASSRRPPLPPLSLTVTVGATNWDTLRARFDPLAHHVLEHGPECNESSGSSDVYSQVVFVSREVDVEAYRAELEAWLKREDERRAKEGES